MDKPTAPSNKIRWVGRSGLFLLLLLPISVIGIRVGLLDFSIGLALFALSCLGCLLILIGLSVVSLMPRFAHHRKQSILWSLPVFPPVLIFGALMGSAGDYPAIHDISSDVDDPPAFTSAAAKIRPPGTNPVDINPEALAIQREAYPDLATIITEESPAEAFEHASRVAESLDWVIYNSDPHIGVIEASYQSFWFGFIDDIHIRIRATEAGTEIDLRSVSRVGRGDLGANANRIRAFGQRYQP
tara:strand:+ start:489 stop:1217 length:729 start_codon:yes stop_codon:yes gene_type:complete